MHPMCAKMMPATFLQPAGQVEEQFICKRCGGLGCDIKVLDCGCSLHARCTPLIPGSIPMTTCPCCQQGMRGLYLIPMSFCELDEAKRVAASVGAVGTTKRGQKRKSATIARLNPQAATAASSAAIPLDDSGSDDLRTGRWTSQEMAYCDLLVDKFESGQLPVVNGTKLNDFLSGMLKSKQSRLTKKMKNAKLSAKAFCKSTGYLSLEDAQAFAQAERDFFQSISCSMERAEIRFHMQKEWREHFSNYCVSVGQPLNADAWLSSVDELDRRMSQAKDQARMQRRKQMMGYALSQDSMNQEHGVFIERSMSESSKADADEIVQMLTNGKKQAGCNAVGMARRLQSAPFLAKTIAYMQRHTVPFEHVDAWVPSFVPVHDGAESKCRLCFAGCATTDVQIGVDQNSFPLSNEDRFDWLAFGEYSQKFSFDVGCGLPGRVYQHGVPSWEQNVENAPHHHFERCGGAGQWGIKTVVALPIPSPSVGRIVVLLYSRSDRTQDQDMVTRMTTELAKLVPNPKWKLVVDVGTPMIRTKGSTMASASLSDSRNEEERQAQEVLTLIDKHTPSNSTSSLAAYLPGFTTLRLMLMKSNRAPKETEMLRTLLGSYASYVASGKPSSEVAWLLARDCMHLSSQQASVTNQPRSHPALMQGAVEHSFTIAPPQISNSNNFETQLNSAAGMYLLQAPLQGTQQLQPQHQFPHPAQGMPPAPSVPAQQGGASSNVTSA